MEGPCLGHPLEGLWHEWALGSGRACSPRRGPPGGGQRCIGRGGGTPPPPFGAPSRCPATVTQRQVPASMAFVTDRNRPQPLWQPPPTACLAASGAAPEALSLPMHHWEGPKLRSRGHGCGQGRSGPTRPFSSSGTPGCAPSARPSGPPGCKPAARSSTTPGSASGRRGR